MRFDVVMPQMGESIAEGTITRWIKKPGETVQRDEPLFEISTDKVDAEIPSPVAGTLVEVRGKEGDTVPVNEVVAVIETEAGVAPTPVEKPAPAATEKPAAAPAARPAPPPAERPAAEMPPEQGAAAFVSPVVRRIAAEHGIDPEAIPGTGAGGRVTKKDILEYLKAHPTPAARPVERLTPAPVERPAVSPVERPAAPAGPRDERVRMTPMRQRIAAHMIESRRASAHVHSVFEVNMAKVLEIRDRFASAYERNGVRLTLTPFFVKAACGALRAFPVVNSSAEGDEIVYHKDLNIGIAVALDWGLIVPVIRNADQLSMAGLAGKVNDLAERARSKRLNPDEVQAGTFTITNFGVFGGVFGLPIINQPQVAILGTGGIQKRPIVIEDAIAIRPVMHIVLGFDHRVVDGAVADQFLAHVKRTLEEFDDALL